MTTAKERHRDKLLRYLSNPDNDYPNRETMALEVLGFKKREQLYNTFTSTELQEIEKEALDIRRTRYASFIAEVDKGLLEKAKGGDAAAAKLVYQRLEGWSEKIKQEHSGDKDNPLVFKHTMDTGALNKALADAQK